jgi:CO/xanthine dehydrogenase Mo-binding subunit
VVVVVAETEAAAEDGANAVIVDYGPLPVLSNMADAIAPNAPLIRPNGLPKDGIDLTAAHAAVDKGSDSGHRAPSNIHEETKFGHGNVDKAIAGADIVLKHHYTTPMVHQGYLEPHAVVAEPHPFRGEITVYTSTQGQFGVRDEVARLLGIPKSKVRVIPMVVGGGFGAKYGILDPLAAAVAWAVRHPVKVVLTRSEDFLTTTPSPAMSIDLTVAAYNDGRIAAIDAVATIDNGVFPFTIGGIVGILIGGYYKCDNVRIVCREVLTHKLQGGAYRAPGAPSATFAIESSMDELAPALGRDPLELRLQNCVETGDLMGNGDPCAKTSVCANASKPCRTTTWWQNRTQEPNTAWGMAAGGWLCGMSPAASVCAVDSDGADASTSARLIFRVSTVRWSWWRKILNIARPHATSSRRYSHWLRAGAGGGSQTTYSVSGAVAAAARVVRQKLIDVAAEQFEANPADLELRDGVVSVKGLPDKSMEIGAIAKLAKPKRVVVAIMGRRGNGYFQRCTGFVTHLVQVHVDPDTGHVTPSSTLPSKTWASRSIRCWSKGRSMVVWRKD